MSWKEIFANAARIAYEKGYMDDDIREKYFCDKDKYTEEEERAIYNKMTEEKNAAFQELFSEPFYISIYS